MAECAFGGGQSILFTRGFGAVPAGPRLTDVEQVEKLVLDLAGLPRRSAVTFGKEPLLYVALYQSRA